MLQEYISGASMMKLLIACKVEPEEVVEGFAKIHYDMNQCTADGLEDSKVRYERLLKLSEYNLGSDLTKRMLRLLESLPDDNKPCHNYHQPGNLPFHSYGMVTLVGCYGSLVNSLAECSHHNL